MNAQELMDMAKGPTPNAMDNLKSKGQVNK